MEQKEGPEFRDIPAHRQQVCGDCKYHNRQAWMRGQTDSTDNYSCTHPEANRNTGPSICGPGRLIAFDSSETPTTPDWCPFLKKTEAPPVDKPQYPTDEYFWNG